MTYRTAFYDMKIERLRKEVEDLRRMLRPTFLGVPAGWYVTLLYLLAALKVPDYLLPVLAACGIVVFILTTRHKNDLRMKINTLRHEITIHETSRRACLHADAKHG